MWAVVHTLENDVYRKRLVNLDHVVKIRMTEETDGEYHKKHDGKAVVLLYKEVPLDAAQPIILENYGVVGELKQVHASVCPTYLLA